MIYLLVVSLFIWLIGILSKTPIPYIKSYQISLHINFIPLVIIFVLYLFNEKISLSFLDILLNVILAIIIVFSIRPVLLSNKNQARNNNK